MSPVVLLLISEINPYAALSPEWLSALAETLTAVVAIAAGCVAWKEYSEKRRRDQVELAQRLMDNLSTDELLRFAVTRLDWGVAILPVPSNWRAVIGTESIELNAQDLYDAMRPALTDETRKNPTRLLYRNAYVELFSFLERLGNLLEAGAIHADDLKPMEWILDQLANWRYAISYKPEDFFLPAINEWYPGSSLVRLLGAVENRTGRRKDEPNSSLKGRSGEPEVSPFIRSRRSKRSMSDRPKGSGYFSAAFGVLFFAAFLASFCVSIKAIPPVWILRTWLFFVAGILIGWGGNRVRTGRADNTVGQSTINFVIGLVAATMALLSLLSGK